MSRVLVDISLKFGGYFVPVTNQKVHDAMNELRCMIYVDQVLEFLKLYIFVIRVNLL